MMEYLEGKSIENQKDNNYRYSKFNLFIYIFMQNNLYINKYNHGDLHNYNWKITDDNKIVIYDFGLCWELNNNDIIDTLQILNDGFYNKNDELVYKSFKNYIKSSSDINEDYIKKYYNSISYKIERFKDFSLHLIYFCLKHNHLLDIKILYNIISYQNITIIFMKKWDNEDNDYHGVYKEEYNICDYYNILPDYKKYLLKQINIFKSINKDLSHFSKFIK